MSTGLPFSNLGSTTFLKNFSGLCGILLLWLFGAAAVAAPSGTGIGAWDDEGAALDACSGSAALSGQPDCGGAASLGSAACWTKAAPHGTIAKVSVGSDASNATADSAGGGIPPADLG